MGSLMIDFIISLDGNGGAKGWPGFWGMESPEYLAWLKEDGGEPYTAVMGANTYRLMADFAADDPDDPMAETPKLVFSSTLEAPLTWANTELVRTDAVEAVRALKQERTLRTLGSLSLCRALLTAGLVDRYRVVIFPVITGATGDDHIFEGYPDVALELVEHRTFAGGLQLLEYIPSVLEGPPSAS